MRVLLIQPPLEDFYTTPIRLYPLGLLYTASVFQKLGCRVGILDSLSPLKKRSLPIPPVFSYLKPFLEKNSLLFKGYYRFGLFEEQIIEHIEAYRPEMVGLASQFTAYYQSVAELAVAIKENLGIPVFIGGNHASVFKAEIKKRSPQIDYVLEGPAEKAVPSFVASLKTPGMRTEPMDWKDIVPAHELLSGQDYKIGRKNYISLTASRGCPYRCEFCSVHAMFGQKIEYRPVENVLSEMRWNYQNKKVRIFNFEDDNLSFNTEWFKRFLKAVIEDPVLDSVELTAMNGICYPTLDKDSLVLMWQAGFRQVNLAFVTQDQDLRQKYRRPAHRPDFERLVAYAQKLGFFITVYVIIGLPDQSYGEIKASIDYLLNLGVLVGPSVFYLPPGSRLFGRLELPEKLAAEWNLYRSSAFALETKHLRRAQLVELFSYTRKRNLENRQNYSGPKTKN